MNVHRHKVHVFFGGRCFGSTRRVFHAITTDKTLYADKIQVMTEIEQPWSGYD